MSLVSISQRLRREVDRLEFAPPVTHVYNPIDYARKPHRAYLERYGAGQPEALLLGMNPGPWGMAQTGVPFGEVGLVHDWMGINEPVARPALEHPRRPVDGFACKRSEVSGARLWGWARDTFRTPEQFFARFFVWNYCPLSFMEESGRNRTPDKLPAGEREELFAICDRSLRDVIRTLNPRCLIGVGKFAEKRLRLVCEDEERLIGSIAHPSPANPNANRGWAERIAKELGEYGIRV